MEFGHEQLVGWDTIVRLLSLSLSVRREPNGCRNRDGSPEVRITRKRIDYDNDNDNDAGYKLLI